MSLAHDPVLSPREVSQQLGRHYKTIIGYWHRGLIEGVKRGGRVYIRQSAVDAFLADDPTESTSVPRTA